MPRATVVYKIKSDRSDQGYGAGVGVATRTTI